MAIDRAEKIWQTVDLVNLREYIAPTKSRANVNQQLFFIILLNSFTLYLKYCISFCPFPNQKRNERGGDPKRLDLPDVSQTYSPHTWW